MSLRGIPSIGPAQAVGMPPGSTNLCSNGGFETNTTGWGTSGSSTITRTTDEALVGTHSLEIAYVDNVDFAYFSITLPAAGRYTQSVGLFIPAAWDGTAVGFRTTGFGGAGDVIVLADMTIRDAWQHLQVPFTVAADLAGLVGYMRAEGTPPTPGSVIYIDAFQVELGGATPYIETDGAPASREPLLALAGQA